MTTPSNDDLRVPWEKMPPPPPDDDPTVRYPTKSGPPALPWVARKTPAPLNITRAKGLCFGLGKFVAVALGNIAMWSVDGVKWNSVPCPTGFWEDVTYGAGKFVAVSSNYNLFPNNNYQIMSSQDGIHWTAHLAPLRRKWCSVAYGDGLWIAIAPTVEPDIWRIRFREYSGASGHTNYGPPRSMYSFNGHDWLAPTDLDILGDYSNLGDPNRGDPVWIVIGGVYYDAHDRESWPDLIALGYNPLDEPSTTRWSSIAFGQGFFVAVSGSDDMWASLERSKITSWPPTSNQFEHDQAIAGAPPWQTIRGGGPNSVNKVTYFDSDAQYRDIGDHVLDGVHIRGKFMAVRYGPQIQRYSFSPPYNYLNPADPNYLVLAHAWEMPAFAGFISQWRPVATPIGNDHGWIDIAGNPNTGTAVAVQPVTAPVPSRTNQFHDIFEQLAAAIAGVDLSVQDRANDDFRAYVPTMLRMEKNNREGAAYHFEFFDPERGSQAGMYIVVDSFLAGLMPLSNTTPRRGYGLIAYGNDRFVCLETESPHRIDPDQKPAYLGNYFDLPIYNTTSYISLDDGLSWTYNIIDGSSDWISVTFGANYDPHLNSGVFVAISSHNAPDPIMWSPDGVDWQRAYVTGTDTIECQWYAVAWGNGRFVALGNTTEGDPVLGGPLPTIMTSWDGKSWSPPQHFTVSGLAPSSGFQGQKLILKSIVWGEEAHRWIAVGHLGGLDSQFLAFGLTDATVVTSTDLETWTAVTDGVPNFTNWNSVTYGGGLYTAVGQFAETEQTVFHLASSNLDEVIPSQPLKSEKVGTVSAIPEDPTFGLVMTSPDGLHWTAHSASHLANWQAVTHCVYDEQRDWSTGEIVNPGKHFLMAINNNYIEAIGINAIAQDILRLIRLLKDAALNREISDNFPNLAIGVGGIYVLQEVANIQAELLIHFDFFLDQISQAYLDIKAKALGLSLIDDDGNVIEGDTNNPINVDKLNYVLSHITMADISDGSGTRISQLLAGSNVFDDLADGYVTQQAMYSVDDGVTWQAMNTLPGTYTSIAWGADYAIAVADQNPYRQTYAEGQVMQSYLHDPWVNAVGTRNGQPPPFAQAWQSVTNGRGRFVAVANKSLVQLNSTDQRGYKPDVTVYDGLVMTCDPFCQPLEPRRTESAAVSTFTKVGGQIQVSQIAKRTVSAVWSGFARSSLVSAIATVTWDVLDGPTPAADKYVTVISDGSDLTFIATSGGGMGFKVTFGDLDNPYQKNIESFRIAVRARRITDIPPDFYPTSSYHPNSSASVVPQNRGDFFDRARRIAADQGVGASLLTNEILEYTYDTYRYAGYPQYDGDYWENHGIDPAPDTTSGPVPTMSIVPTGLDDMYMYSRGQNLNPDNSITTFNSLQYQKMGATYWTPEEFKKLAVTINLSGAPGDMSARIYSVQCLVTYEPDWHKPSCDPARFWRPPITHADKTGDWNVEPPMTWRLAREMRARWDVKQVYLQVQDPCNRWAFRPEDIAPIDKTRFTP